MSLPHASDIPCLEIRDDYFGDEFLVQVLSSLVRARSVNPEHYERAAIETARNWLEPAGIECYVIEFAEGRPSLAGIIRGSGDGPTLTFNGHIDTVPIDDVVEWTSDPFELEVRDDGFAYGRGACDMKGGLTAQIGAALYLASAPERLAGDVIVQFAAGEECGEPGTLSLIKAGYGGDFAIVTEPTELNVAIAERGLCCFRFTIRGRSIHGSRAHLGVNPNLELAALLRILGEYQDDIVQRGHPLLPGGSCTPTVIRSGVQYNAVPDTCEIMVDRRLLPGETVQGELEDLRRRVADLELTNSEASITVELLEYPLPFEAAEIADSSEFAVLVRETAAESLGEDRPFVGTPYSSDVRNFVNDGGIEAVTFGPGNVAECHCANERIEVRQLGLCARTLVRTAEKLLGA
jgi:succinyl-diaminopimelate desuccinylase